MFSLRRAVVRALSRPAPQFSSPTPICRVTAVRSQQPAIYRFLHQSWKACAEEQRIPLEPEESVPIEQSESGEAPAAHAAEYSPSTSRPLRMEQIPISKNLYIGNLFFEVTAPQLEAEFGQYGEVTNCKVVTDTRGLSKGFGYVEFADQEAATKALNELNMKLFNGRRMTVQYQRPLPVRSGNRRSGTVNPPSKTLYVGNMSYQMSDRDLNDLFREVRNVLDVRVAIDRRTGQPRGFAHADFVDIESAERAKELLEKKIVYGRQLRLDYSTNSTQAGNRASANPQPPPEEFSP